MRHLMEEKEMRHHVCNDCKTLPRPYKGVGACSPLVTVQLPTIVATAYGSVE